MVYLVRKLLIVSMLFAFSFNMPSAQALKKKVFVYQIDQTKRTPKFFKMFTNKVKRFKKLRKQVKVLPLPKIMKAARKAGVKRKDLQTKANLLNVLMEVEVSRLVLMETEPVMRGKKKKRPKGYNITLSVIDVASGQDLFKEQIAVKGKRLKPRQMKQMLNNIIEPLTTDEVPKPEVAEAPVEAPEEATEAAASAEMPPAEEPAVDAQTEAIAQAPVEETAPEPAPPVVEEPAPEPTPPSITETTPEEEVTQIQPEPEPTPPPEPVKPAFKKKALFVNVGGSMLTRSGKLRVSNAGAIPPQYLSIFDEDTLGNKGAFFSGVDIGLDFYPMSLVDPHGGAINGLGLKVDALLGFVRTLYGDEEFSDTMISINSDLHFKYYVMGYGNGFVFDIGAGYSYFSFPLSRSPFPSMNYSGPSARISLGWAVKDFMDIMLSYSYYPMIMAGSDTTSALAVGGDLDNGQGWNTNFALTIYPIDMLMVGLKLNYTEYATEFTGSTNLQGVTDQYDDARVIDTYIGGTFFVGVRF